MALLLTAPAIASDPQVLNANAPAPGVAYNLASLQMLEAAQTESDVRSPDVDLRRFDPSMEFETYRALAARDGFFVIEQALLADLANAPDAQWQPAALQLVYLYMAHDLYAEALSVVGERLPDTPSAELKFLAGVSSYEMSRYDDAVKYLSDRPLELLDAAAPWRGMANARRGAFKDASDDLFNVRRSSVPFETNAADFYLAQALTALKTNDYVQARASIARMKNLALTEAQRSERRLTEAMLLSAQGQTEDARALFRQLAALGAGPYSNLASLKLIEQALSGGSLSPESAQSRIEGLVLTWQGGPFEREALALKAMLADQAGDIAAAFRCRRKLIDDHSASDVAAEAGLKLAGDLKRLFENKQLSPMAAAQIFYENIDFAPPGREGDVLIRKVAAELRGLDLLDEAAELLRHQVFTRLRGQERSQTAADLAELYLADNRPLDALTVLRATRLARLPQAINDRRRWLEAQALTESGKTEMALVMLEEDETAPAFLLRGGVYFAAGDWAKAGAEYAAAVDKVAVADGVLSNRDTQTALKAASAFALAGENKKLRAFAEKTEAHMKDDAAKSLLRSLAYAGLVDDPAAFQAAFDKYFDSAGAGS